MSELEAEVMKIDVTVSCEQSGKPAEHTSAMSLQVPPPTKLKKSRDLGPLLFKLPKNHLGSKCLTFVQQFAKEMTHYLDQPCEEVEGNPMGYGRRHIHLSSPSGQKVPFHTWDKCTI